MIIFKVLRCEGACKYLIFLGKSKKRSINTMKTTNARQTNLNTEKINSTK